MSQLLPQRPQSAHAPAPSGRMANAPIQRPQSAHLVAPSQHTASGSTQRPQSARALTPSSARSPRVRPRSAGTTYDRDHTASIAAEAQAQCQWADEVFKGSVAPLANMFHGTPSTSESNRGRYKDQMLQAAIIQLAPNSHIAPCRHGTCCWRWAARRLMDECELSQRNARQLREAFYEELGDSVVQQLINMQQAYAELQDMMRGTQDQLEAKCHRSEKLESQLQDAKRARSEAEADRETTDQAHKELSKHAADLSSKIKALESQVEELEQPKKQLLAMERQCRDSEARAVQAEALMKKAQTDLQKEETARAELELRVRQLAVHEKDHIEARSKLRRKKKGAGGKDALRPSLRKVPG